MKAPTPNDHRDLMVTLRVTREEAAWLDTWAVRLGMNRSDTLRVLLGRAGSAIPEAGEDARAQ